MLNDLLRSQLVMLILDKYPIMRKSDYSRDAWVRFPVSALFKANNGGDVLQVEFSANQGSFGQINEDCILRKRAIKHLDIPVLVLNQYVRRINLQSVSCHPR